MTFKPLVMVVTLLAASGVAADVSREESWAFEVNEGARISLENINGNISVEGVSGDTVEITALLKAGTQEYLDDMKVLIKDSADAIHIETDLPRTSGLKKWFNWNTDSSSSVTYTLRVPVHANLDEVESVNGNVRVEAVKGTVKAGAVNGKVEGYGLVGDARIETVNGSVYAAFDRLEGHQKAVCESVNGKIVVKLPPDADASVTAETINGGIDGSDFDLKTNKGFVGRDLDGNIGDGSARLTVSTVNGSIKINRK